MEPVTVDNLAAVTEIDGISIYKVDAPGYVQGVSTSVVGMVGEFERGQSGIVHEIGSTPDFKEKLGSYGKTPTGVAETAWKGYGGYVAMAGKQWPAFRAVRPTYDDAAAASVAISLIQHVAEPLAQGRTLTLTAPSAGDYGNRIVVKVENATDTTLTNGFRLVVTDVDGGRSQTIDNLYAGMTPTQLAAALTAQGFNIVTAAIADDGTAGAPAARPSTHTLAGGANGTPTLLAWTNALDLLFARRDINILFVAEPDGAVVTRAGLNAYIKSKIKPTTGVVPRIVACLSGESGQDAATAVTDAANYRSERMGYFWAYRYQSFPEASPIHVDGKLLVSLDSAVASALANTDPVFDPACARASQYINACTIGLEFDNLDRDDYVTANKGGVAAIEFDPDLGYRLVNGITTDLTPDKNQIHVTRVADFLELSMARSLKPYQNEPITEEWKDTLVGILTEFLERQKDGTDAPVARIKDYVIDIDSVNSPSTEAQGLFFIKIKVRVVGSARFIVFLSQIGTTVTIERQDTALAA